MIGVVIQARMGSTRLPGKVLKRIGDKCLLGQILFRLSSLKNAEVIVVATSQNEADDQIEAFCRSNGIRCFRGSEHNVLERYHHCAEHYGLTHVVRATGDNPFIDAIELDKLIALHLSKGADYSSCVEGLPIGVGSEIFTRRALERSYERATLPHHFEHVNEYILENKGDFSVAALKIPESKRSAARLTVDTEEDYRRACFIVAHCCSDPVSSEEAIALAERFASL